MTLDFTLQSTGLHTHTKHITESISIIFFTLSYDWMVWYGNKQHNVVIFGVSKNRSTLILSL